MVDDEASIRKLLDRKFTMSGYVCAQAEDGMSALDQVRQDKFDLVVTDIRMPRIDGINLIEEIKRLDSALSVIMMTGYTDVDTAIEALRHGAFDYQLKPLDFDRLTVAVTNGIERTRLLRDRAEYMIMLEAKVRERTEELAEKNRSIRKFFFETVMALVSAVEAKDKYTEGHSRRVADNARLVARRLGMPEDEIERIYIAGVLHDVGKIGVPDAVLHKPGVFTPEETAIMKNHPTLTAAILANVEDFSDIIKMTLHHHERFDGKGYPAGLTGELIPLGARILSVADAFDAMTSDRPYRPRLTLTRAIEELDQAAGTQLDPDVTGTFLSLIDQDMVTVEKK